MITKQAIVVILMDLLIFSAGVVVGISNYFPEVEVKFNKNVGSSSYQATAEYPHCVQVKYEFPAIEKLICYKLEIK